MGRIISGSEDVPVEGFCEQFNEHSCSITGEEFFE
jgi:hypothetical protein